MSPPEQLAIGKPEPRVILEIEEKPDNFLFDIGDTFPVLLSTPGQLCNHSVIKGVTGQPVTKFFSHPLGCIWGDLIFSLLLNNA